MMYVGVSVQTTLGPEVICRACTYYDGTTSTYKQPEWREHPTNVGSKGQSGSGASKAKDGSGAGGPSKEDQAEADKLMTPSPYRYYPSANQTPTKFTPVLFKSDGENVIQPMMWGLIPPWHKGEAKNHGLSTNNCRLEGVETSKLYKRPLTQRKLCVILAQGFYEWKSVGAQPKVPKQPYMIHMTQDDPKLSIHDDALWNNAEWNEEEGWKGPKILRMAGLYDIWNSPTGDVVYSYTVITMQSNETLSWLHDRMPAILETPEQVQAWLDASPETSTAELLNILKPSEKLQWYTVSTKVNNSRCRDMDCMNPVDLKEAKSNTFMANWLKKAEPKKTKPSDSDDERIEKDKSAAKKPKKEEK